MAIMQMSSAALDVDAGATGAPLIVLYERDDTIAVPLLSQLRLTGYDVRASRTPVELFDTLSKHLVALVLVDLGNATAGRREFWVALDAHRRGRQLQVMTFRYLPDASPLDTDLHTTARAIADVEVRGAQDFQAILAGVRQRVPLHGDVSAIPGMGAAPGVISPLSPGSVPSPFAQGLDATANPYAAPMAYGVPAYDPASSFGGPRPGFGMLPANPYDQPFGQPSSQAGFGGPVPVSPVLQPGFAAPQVTPFSSTSPFAAEAEASPFAQPYSANPFAADMAAAAPPPSQPAPFGQPQQWSSPSLPPQWLGPAAQPSPDLLEAQAARLSEQYAAQFGIPGREQNSTAHPPFAAGPGQGWDMGYGQGQTNGFGGSTNNGLGNGHAANGFGGMALPVVNTFGGDPYAAFGAAPSPNGAANGHAAADQSAYGVAPFEPERSGAPVADVWTPPDGDLNGDTGVVPEMAYQPFPDGSYADIHTERHAASARTWIAPASQPRDTGGPSATAVHRTPRHTGEPTAPVPAASRLPVPRMTEAEQALGSVLIEGALLSSDKLEVLRGIQQMLNSVDMHFKLGELALLFKFLSPDQLLAALLVSRGLVSPQQIAGLGRVKQELAASGMDYDLETLLTMFHIMPPEQLRVFRAELGG